MCKLVFLIPLLIMLLGSSTIAQTARLTKAGAPQPATLAEYDATYCVSLPTHIRVCKGLAAPENTFLVEKAGKRLGQWPGMAFLGETSDFEVLRGDLDGDRNAELIVLNHDGSSNGLGVRYGTVFIFSDPEFRRFQPPLTFSVEEYGSFGTFVPTSQGVDILTTRWLWSTDPQGRRGEGLYLVGQWWRYRLGELSPILGRPLLARRYLASFEKERWQTISNAQAPYKWLRSPKAEILRVDPHTGTKVKSVQRGVLQEVSMIPLSASHRTVQLVFQPEGQQAVTYVYPPDTLGKRENALRYIGDAATGRVYPDKYLPSQPEAWLRGRQVSLGTYGEGTPLPSRQILWLEPKVAGRRAANRD